jgi:hypothetical protein
VVIYGSRDQINGKSISYAALANQLPDAHIIDCAMQHKRLEPASIIHRQGIALY